MIPADRLRLEVAVLEAEASAAIAMAGGGRHAAVALLEADAADAAGWRRALHPWEHHAMFAGIEEETGELARRIADQLADMRAALGAAIVDLATDLEPAALARTLLATGVNGIGTLPTLDAVVASAEEALRQVLTEAAVAGAASAAPTGTPDGIADAILARVSDDVDVAVVRATRTIAAQTIEAAAEVAAAGGPGLADRIADTVDALSDARLRDAASTAANNVYGAGRGATPDVVTDTPAAIYASELRDANTCGPCAEVDGREYSTLEEARRDYPAGRYRDCQGGARCRGTLVFVWPDEADPTLQQPGD